MYKFVAEYDKFKEDIMSIHEIQRTVIKKSGNTYRSVAPAFNVSSETSASKLGRGLRTIDDWIRLCDYCETRIFMECKDGTIIPLTIEDLED